MNGLERRVAKIEKVAGSGRRGKGTFVGVLQAMNQARVAELSGDPAAIADAEAETLRRIDLWLARGCRFGKYLGHVAAEVAGRA